jgi:hypothetical protein
MYAGLGANMVVYIYCSYGQRYSWYSIVSQLVILWFVFTGEKVCWTFDANMVKNHSFSPPPPRISARTIPGVIVPMCLTFQRSAVPPPEVLSGVDKHANSSIIAAADARSFPFVAPNDILPRRPRYILYCYLRQGVPSPLVGRCHARWAPDLTTSWPCAPPLILMGVRDQNLVSTCTCYALICGDLLPCFH